MDVNKNNLDAIMNNKKSMVLLFLPAILWTNESYPARMSSDSLWPTWNEVLNGNYTADHPVIYTLFVKFTSLNGNFLVLTTLIQNLLLTLALFLLVHSILNNFFYSALIASFIMLTPFGGAFGSTIWKDVPFTIFLIIGIVYLYKWIQYRSRKYLFMTVFFITFGIMFRHNGVIMIFILILFFFLLSFFLNTKLSLKIVLILFFSIGLSMASTSALNKFLNAESTFASWMTAYPFMTDLAFAAATRPDLVDQETIRLVDLYAKSDAFEGAKNCSSGGYMIIAQGFTPENIVDKKFILVKAWLVVLRNHPEIIMQARMCRTQPFMPPPFSPGPIHPTWNANGIYQPNEFDLVSNPPFKELASAMRIWQSLWTHNTNKVAWPGKLWLIGTISLLIILFIDQKRDKFFQLALYQLLSTSLIISLIALAPSPDFRYAAISQLIGLMFFLIFLFIVFNFLYENYVRSLRTPQEIHNK